MTGPRDEYRPAAPLRPVLRTRESAYAYECRACGRCCHDKLIPVNPYEIARLAANRGLSTTELIERFTEEGVALAVGDDGACLFLGERGCEVHPDRPLVCRLYPLGAVTDPEGRELFVELEAQPGSEGRAGADGTVAAYLQAQGVAPYLEMAHRYRETVEKLVRALALGTGAAEAAATLRGSVDGADARVLDVDLALAGLERRGLPLPQRVEDRVRLHISVLEAEIPSLSA